MTAGVHAPAVFIFVETFFPHDRLWMRNKWSAQRRNGGEGRRKKQNPTQMKMNKLTAMAALAFATLMTINATAADQPKVEGKERPAGVRPGGGKIADELGLSAEQKTKLQAVRKDAAEKGKAIREDASLTPEQRREKIKAIAEESKTKQKEILTPEQFAKLEEMQKNRPGRPGGPGSPGGGHKPADAPAKTK